MTPAHIMGLEISHPPFLQSFLKFIKFPVQYASFKRIVIGFWLSLMHDCMNPIFEKVLWSFTSFRSQSHKAVLLLQVNPKGNSIETLDVAYRLQFAFTNTET